MIRTYATFVGFITGKILTLLNISPFNICQMEHVVLGLKFTILTFIPFDRIKIQVLINISKIVADNKGAILFL